MTPALPLNAATAAAVTSGRLVSGHENATLRSFSIDTRTLRPGDTFIAITGPNFDGNAFVADAVAKGAPAVIVSTSDAAQAAKSLGLVSILVGDTETALQQLARHVRRVSKARVVAVTGSTGKTTTKEAIATLLDTRFRTMRNRGNLNNHIGLPLSLLELQGGAEIAVVELGMNHAGEISTLVSIAEPDVRVWTNVGAAHLEFFGSLDAIADAKAEVLEGARAETLVVANADDPRVMARIQGFAGRVVTFGIESPADVKAGAIDDRGIDGQTADVHTPAGFLRLALKLPGRGHLANVLAAIAVALHFAVPLSEIALRVSTLEPSYHRGEVLHLGRGIRVVDDSYNSSPSGLSRALEVLAATKTNGRKLAVLGEMLELGEKSESLHQDCGRQVARSGVAGLVTVGGAPARALGEAARVEGLADDAVVHAENSIDATQTIEKWLEAGDLVLVKGSRGIRLERVVERLKAELA